MCKNYGADVAGVLTHVSSQFKSAPATLKPLWQTADRSSGRAALPGKTNTWKTAQKSIALQMIGRAAVAHRTWALMAGEDSAK